MRLSRALALQLIAHGFAAFIVNEDESSVLDAIYAIDSEVKLEAGYLEKSLLLGGFDCEGLFPGALDPKPVENESFKPFALRKAILLVKGTFPIGFYSLSDRLAHEYTQPIIGCRTKTSLCLKLLPDKLERFVQ